MLDSGDIATAPWSRIMKMDSVGSDHSPDHSPPLSDNQGEAWWENDDSSVSGLNLVGSPGLHDLVEDKEVAARAVAFVVSSTRKGIVPLCADVANILRSKKALEKKVLRLKCENESLRSSRAGSVQTSHSASPPVSVNSTYSDRGSQPHDRSSRPCSRCSSHCSSYTSNNSPKFDKTRRQRSPQFFASVQGRRCSADAVNGNHQVVVTALVHHPPEEAPGGGQPPPTSPPSGGSPPNHGHQRKGSLPQMVSEPHAGLPKVSPATKRVSVGVQVALEEVKLAEAKDTKRLEEKVTETLKVNAQLSSDLAEANRVIETLRTSLKELEMKQLAHECLEEYELECQSDSGPTPLRAPPPRATPLTVPILQRGDSMRSSKSSLRRRTSAPTLIPSPLDGCSCRNCKDQTTTRSTLVIPPKNGLSTEVSGRLQLEEGDHVVVRGERTGHVCYIGHLDDFTPAEAIFVGLQLDAPVGRHDGAVNGHRYYQCARNHGVFVPLQDILCIIAKKSDDSHKSTASLERVETVSVMIEMEPAPRDHAADRPEKLANSIKATKSEKSIKTEKPENCDKSLAITNKRNLYTDPLRINMDDQSDLV